MEKIIERVNNVVKLLNRGHRMANTSSIEELIEYQSSNYYKRQMQILKDLIWCLDQLGLNYQIEYNVNGNVSVKEVA